MKIAYQLILTFTLAVFGLTVTLPSTSFAATGSGSGTGGSSGTHPGFSGTWSPGIIESLNKTEHCGVSTSLSTNTDSEPTQYTFSATYTSDPESGYTLYATTVEISCLKDGSECSSSIFSSESSSYGSGTATATLNPDEEASYKITATTTVDCRIGVTQENETSSRARYLNVTFETEEEEEEETEECDAIIAYFPDADGDGYGDEGGTATDFTECSTEEELSGYVSNNTDCDDTNADINPGATEIVDSGTDENCDGTSESTTVSIDSDGDGYDISSDCNDLDANINPDASETCDDGVDNDCDDDVDDDDIECMVDPNENVEGQAAGCSLSDGGSPASVIGILALILGLFSFRLFTRTSSEKA